MSASSEYTINLPGDVAIGISSNRELAIGSGERLLLGAYLPGLEVEQGVRANACQQISHIESTDRSFRQGGNEIEIRDKWNGQFPLDLPHLLYGIARACWLRENLYSVHAACIKGLGEDTTLLPGHSGTGKSTVALKLAEVHNQKIISGNTTLIDFSSGKMKAVAGTLTMTLRTEDFKCSNIDPSEEYEYGDRTAFRIDSERYVGLGSAISCIALIRVSDSEQSWYKMEPTSALHQLYPYFLDTIHQDVITCHGEGLYIGPEASDSRLVALRALRGALKDVPVYQATGSSGLLAEKLATV